MREPAVFAVLLTLSCAAATSSTGCSRKKAVEATRPTVDAQRPKVPTRAEVLGSSAAKLGIASHPGVFGVLIETGTAEGPATLLALADGRASLALETSEWGIRDNGHARVRAGAERLCELGAKIANEAAPARDLGRPQAGWVRVFLLTDSGVRSIEAEASLLGDGRHRLSPLFLLGNDVITRLRIASQTL